MSRRRSEVDPGVGSDSFLDVLANIVGILIILIVVAGVRVSRAPVVVPPTVQPSSPELDEFALPETTPAPAESETLEPIASAAAAADPLPLIDEPLAAGVEAPAAVPLAEPPAPPSPPPPIQPSPGLLREIAALERELEDLDARFEAERSQRDAAERTSRDAAQQLTSAAAALDAARSQLATEHQRLSALERTLKATQGTLEKRRQLLASAATQSPDAQPIRHRLTPVSHAVKGREIHFHLSRGRVAYVPVDELVERLKTDISRQKNWLARVPRHEGRVGPVSGFSMAYVVERQSMSVLDELRVGGAVRISLSEWRIIPEADFPSESAAEAVASGSAFIRRLQTTGLDTALTFWVYPDSFAEFRELQELARAEGFTVAARPLPEGTPIAASPQGTRSAGQ